MACRGSVMALKGRKGDETRRPDQVPGVMGDYSQCYVGGVYGGVDW